MGTKLTLIYPLFQRRTPSNEEAPLGYLNNGSTLTIEDVVIGKPIDGNSLWYKADDGLYYWSGGMADAEFMMKKDFTQLSLKQQYQVASEAMRYYYGKISITIDGLTGMSVAFKKSDGRYKDHYALVIQVKQKSKTAAISIPEFLPYHGFPIPTDIEEAEKTVSSVLGDSVSRKNFLSDGSAGFITTRLDGDELILVTNYHVACPDLIKGPPRRLSFTEDDMLVEASVVMPARSQNIIGKVIEGRLDAFNDVALVQLNESVLINNDIKDIGEISGTRTLQSIEDGFQPQSVQLRMFGAKTNAVTKGFIESCNASQTIVYLNGAFEHELHGLIQVEKMSQPGDSGSAVLDMSNQLVGILVAADNKFSYVLPIENVVQNFNLNNP
jgi:hypothetical protein